MVKTVDGVGAAAAADDGTEAVYGDRVVAGAAEHNVVEAIAGEVVVTAAAEDDVEAAAAAACGIRSPAQVHDVDAVAALAILVIRVADMDHCFLILVSHRSLPLGAPRPSLCRGVSQTIPAFTNY